MSDLSIHLNPSMVTPVKFYGRIKRTDREKILAYSANAVNREHVNRCLALGKNALDGKRNRDGTRLLM